jgi:hypothetical protein
VRDDVIEKLNKSLLNRAQEILQKPDGIPLDHLKGLHGLGDDVGDEIRGEIHHRQDHFDDDLHDLDDEGDEAPDGFAKGGEDALERADGISEIADAERIPEIDEKRDNTRRRHFEACYGSADPRGGAVDGAGFFELIELLLAAIHQAHEAFDDILHRAGHGGAGERVASNDDSDQAIAPDGSGPLGKPPQERFLDDPQDFDRNFDDVTGN